MQRASLRDRRHHLLARTELHGPAWCRAYAAAADAWLCDLAEHASGGRPAGLALIAVGGFGRAELAPFSDLDLVLVHTKRRDVAAVADQLFYPVWDEGVRLDHSVRRAADMLPAADADLRVALGLLDARMVWGDPDVARPVLAGARERWRARTGPKALGDLEAQMRERRLHHGDVAFVLEPDLKEGHGGLRDVNVLRAAVACAPELVDLVDLDAVEHARTVLVDARVEVQRTARRSTDRLLLEEQDRVASALGDADADALMARVAGAGRSVAWACSGAWRRQHLWAPRSGARRRSRAARRPQQRAVQAPCPHDPRVLIVDEEVVLDDDPGATHDAPDAVVCLRLAAVAAEHGLAISRPTLRRLADTAGSPPEPWPREARETFVRVLLAGHGAVEVLEELDEVGVLARLVPEWAAVRNRPQRNAYHRYTVDRHLLEAAANAAALSGRVGRPDLLVVGALLHDIGKGWDGDHTDAGVVIVQDVARRMGFSPDDVRTLARLCRHHLLLADTATRRDLEDPATVETVARAVGDTGTLHLLWALTEADSRATGPAAWGPWKAGLVAELVERAQRRLEGAPAPGRRRRLLEDRHAVMEQVRATGRPVVEVSPPNVVVAAPDRPGLLAAVAGTLALHGLNVRSADVAGTGGVAVEVYDVEPMRGSYPASAPIREQLEAALSGAVALDELLSGKAQAYVGARRPSTASPIVPSVHVDNEASATSTVIEVRARDELGLLHRVTRVLFDCDLDVVSARVSTIGDAVVDAFYVRDASGLKLTDADALERLREALLATLR